MKESYEILESKLDKALEELQIVYNLVDLMYSAIIQGKSHDMEKAASDYYDWLHAGETVNEEEEY